MAKIKLMTTIKIISVILIILVTCFILMQCNRAFKVEKDIDITMCDGMQFVTLDSQHLIEFYGKSIIIDGIQYNFYEYDHDIATIKNDGKIYHVSFIDNRTIYNELDKRYYYKYEE